MSFVPHTPAEQKLMLQAVGLDDIRALFDEIPAGLRDPDLSQLPEGRSEMRVLQYMQHCAERDSGFLNFMGAGAYEHYIPSVVWDLVGRGEFMTAYTPYQAEASQGTLQVIYEFQSMITRLTGMEVANASLYDGSSALAEACLMALRGNKKPCAAPQIVLPQTLNPSYAQVVHTINRWQSVDFSVLPMDGSQGTLDLGALDTIKNLSALVIAQPNFLGQLEAVDLLTDWAHQRGAWVIALVNPISLGILKPPSAWGSKGADIVVGEGQPLGVPLSGGGPYFGLMACKKRLVRQMPGRIVGRTQDLQGKVGYTLTLQAREQHIRRAKATSNICTNQGLAVTAATIYMSTLGGSGLRDVALSAMQNTRRLVDGFKQLGLQPKFSGPRFHEVVFTLPHASRVLDHAARQKVLAGYHLSSVYPESPDDVLFCATETKTHADIDRLIKVIAEGLALNPC